MILLVIYVNWCWFKTLSQVLFKAIYLSCTVLLPTVLSFDLCEWCWIKALVTSFIYLNVIYSLWLELPPIALIYLLYFFLLRWVHTGPEVHWSDQNLQFLDPHQIKMIGPEDPSKKKIGHEVPWSSRSGHEVPW